MDLVQLLVYVIIIGAVFGLVWRFLLPLLPPPFGTVAMVIMVIIVILWLLSLVGALPRMRVGDVQPVAITTT